MTVARQIIPPARLLGLGLVLQAGRAACVQGAATAERAAGDSLSAAPATGEAFAATGSSPG